MVCVTYWHREECTVIGHLYDLVVVALIDFFFSGLYFILLICSSIPVPGSDQIRSDQSLSCVQLFARSEEHTSELQSP